MSRWIGQVGHRQGGQSMVEFALVTPLFVLFLVGMLDFGQAFFQYNQLVNGVREGARVATYDQSTTAISNAVISTTTLGLTTSDITITCYASGTSTTKSCATLAIGDDVKVAATKIFQPFTPKIIALLGSSITLNASSKRSVQ